MSTMETFISIIGSIASIGGAIWAWREASKASTSATKAEKVRDEIINRRVIIEVSQVYTDTKRILSVVSKVGPSSDTKRLTGVDSVGIAQAVQDYSQFIHEHSSHFSAFFENKASELCGSLNDDIVALSEAQSPTDKKTIGTSIYYKIFNFLPITKNLADDKKEDVSVTS